jgi:nitrilase
VEPAQIINARRSLDVVGHYSRPDIFKLNVNMDPMTPVTF